MKYIEVPRSRRRFWNEDLKSMKMATAKSRALM